MRTLFVLFLATVCFGLGVNIVNAAPAVYVEGVGGPSGLPRLKAISDRSEAVGWPHKPSTREMYAVTRAVLREHTAAAGPRVTGAVNCNFGPRMGSFVYCTVLLVHRERVNGRVRTIRKTYYARYKFYEDGSSRVEYDGF